MKSEEQIILSMLRELKASVESRYGFYKDVSLKEFLGDLENDRINARLKLHPFGGEERNFTEYRKQVAQYRKQSTPECPEFRGYIGLDKLVDAA